MYSERIMVIRLLIVKKLPLCKKRKKIDTFTVNFYKESDKLQISGSF